MRPYRSSLRVLLPLIAALGAGPVWAQTPTGDTARLDMAQIEAAWQANDFETVRAGLESLAVTTTDPLVQFRYARVLAEGIGGPRDVAQAVTYLERAVAQNYLPAQTLLARVLLSPGAIRDPERAAALLSNAAARGAHEAQYYLGLLYLSGTGLARDPAAAFNWFQAAGENQNAQAQLELAKLYLTGLGTEQNIPQGARWMQEAAQAGIAEAQFQWAEILAQGVLPAQGKALQSALEWYDGAARQGHVPAQRTLGTLYLTGAEGLAPDATLAAQWLTAAATAGDVSAMNNLGVAYAAGTVLPQDEAQAREWLQAASDAGLARSSFFLARMYETGRGGGADLGRAVAIYRLAVGQGSAPALDRLGALTLDGALDDVVPPHDAVDWVMARLATTADDADALAWMQAHATAGVRPAQAALGQWYARQPDRAAEGYALMEQAARAGHVPSQFRLGRALTTGDGITLDYVAAHTWLNIAATSGHAEAASTRDLITDLMTPDQLAAAQGAARTFFETAQPGPRAD